MTRAFAHNRALLRVLAAGFLAAVVVALLLLTGPGRAQAQSPQNCFGSTGYQVCEDPGVGVLGASVNQGTSGTGSLPATGSDTSKLVVAGTVFVILGGAALGGAVAARRSRD